MNMVLLVCVFANKILYISINSQLILFGNCLSANTNVIDINSLISACPKIRQNCHFERSEKSYSIDSIGIQDFSLWSK